MACPLDCNVIEKEKEKIRDYCYKVINTGARVALNQLIDRWMDGWMDGWLDGWKDGRMDGRMEGWIDR